MDAFLKNSQKRVLKNSALSTNLECRLWTKVRKSTGPGYGVTSYRSPLSGKRSTLHAHRLSYMVFTGSMGINGLDVSHLCHNPLCILVDHLSAEPHYVNASRIACVNRNVCMGHGAFSKCLLHLRMAD